MGETNRVVGAFRPDKAKAFESGSELINLSVRRGLDDDLLSQLIDYTAIDADVQRFTSDKNRFKSRLKFEEWAKTKQRTMYALTNGAGKLFGIYWLGKEALPGNIDFIIDFNHDDYNVTAGIRLYGEARGKGWAKEFRDMAVNDFLNMPGNEDDGIWGDVSEDNHAARASLIKNGYVQATKLDSRGKIIYISPISKLR